MYLGFLSHSPLAALSGTVNDKRRAARRWAAYSAERAIHRLKAEVEEARTRNAALVSAMADILEKRHDVKCAEGAAAHLESFISEIDATVTQSQSGNKRHCGMLAAPVGGSASKAASRSWLLQRPCLAGSVFAVGPLVNLVILAGDNSNWRVSTGRAANNNTENKHTCPQILFSILPQGGPFELRL